MQSTAVTWLSDSKPTVSQLVYYYQLTAWFDVSVYRINFTTDGCVYVGPRLTITPALYWTASWLHWRPPAGRRLTNRFPLVAVQHAGLPSEIDVNTVVTWWRENIVLDRVLDWWLQSALDVIYSRTNLARRIRIISLTLHVCVVWFMFLIFLKKLLHLGRHFPFSV